MIAHYRVEPGAFYGLDLSRLLPYTLARTWHLQLAIFWVATAWVAGGLLLAPLVGGAEPRGQRAGVVVLLVALAVVVFGSLFGEYLGINGALGQAWFWLGHQGSEYLDLGRFWQILLAVGLVFWLVLLYRALRPVMRQGNRSELGALVPVRRGGDPALLSAGALLRPAHELRRDRQLALLDHPPVGRGLLRAVRDGPRGGDVPSPGTRHREDGDPRGVPRRDSLPGWRASSAPAIIGTSRAKGR